VRNATAQAASAGGASRKNVTSAATFDDVAVLASIAS